ncbi:E3 ubiquitin-protein ligase APD2-like isoform X2 [Malania oleifera]|uniref:E3 ubiquitin-protein ligase APD2-like isoform X2 n=1 Tax=Malania oleifera TaxID=397392 RepID=UPI0025AE3A4C|nr:E3 ubiquitin-protein ligase APD2-like isoform X2 [Malania oleifera]
MYRPVVIPPIHHPQRWQDSWPRLLAPLTIWICVSVTLRYGYYGSSHLVLGPSTSRLMKASSVFVKQVEVRDDARKGVFLYGFSEKPELSLETNWSVSDFVIVGSYNRKGFSLWLNKGSRIRMRWNAKASSLSSLQVFLIKGELKYETLLPNPTDANGPNDPIDGREAEYTIKEDDRYRIDIINMNPRSIVFEMNVNVSSVMYDTTKAKSMCSTENGSCRLALAFPITQFVILTTPNNGVLDGWNVELSFVARVVTYVAILGFIVIVIFFILKYLGACDGERNVEQRISEQEITERDPLMPVKEIRFTYGTGEGQESGASNSSSEDLYDGKICVICYDERRNCFFVPCGHCAACYDCAQRYTQTCNMLRLLLHVSIFRDLNRHALCRIIDEENKACPICRRLIHKVRKLYNSQD